MNSESGKPFPLRQAYAFARENGLADQTSEIQELEIEWQRGYDSKLRRGYMTRLLEDHGLYSEFVQKYWPNGATPDGEARRRRGVKYADEYDAFLSGALVGGEEETESATSESLEFALEAHLRDFLAKNLNQVEPGLRLYQADGKSGIEFAVANGRIDILAVDSKGAFVVIELKLSQGRNKALGQLLYYMGWVDRNLKNGSCRGMIIANEISEELKIAVSRAAGVTLLRYNMNFSIASVD